MAELSNWRDLYPFQSNWLDLDGLRYHYVDEGAGEPLLMVHGNPTWSFYWRNLIGAFRDTHRAIAVDHIGCGWSDKPQRYPYTLAQHIDNLVQLIERLDLRDYTLIAHDWGGAIGLGAALATSDRAARIVLMNTAAFLPPYVPWRIRMCRTPLLGALAVRGLNGFARAALTMTMEKPERMTPQVRAGLLAPYDNWRNRVAVHAFVRDIPLSQRHVTWNTLEQMERDLPTLADRPIQLIWGMRDWCFRPECLERLLRSFPAAETHRIEDAGHYVVEDAHEQIIPLLRQFLDHDAVEASRAATPHDAANDNQPAQS